ncbi:MAG: hypothetical protein ABEJ96_04255 [Thiohalorhabdaceae bacterium]
MKYGSVTALALVAFAMAGSAHAGEKPPFKKADANSDGKVSIQEAQQAGAPKKEAKTEDLDNNGKLTQSDWSFVDFESAKGSSQGSGAGQS